MVERWCRRCGRVTRQWRDECEALELAVGSALARVVREWMRHSSIAGAAWNARSGGSRPRIGLNHNGPIAPFDPDAPPSRRVAGRGRNQPAFSSMWDRPG